ncbi:hypothetical protein FIS41_05105, partial [Escherichia coli]
WKFKLCPSAASSEKSRRSNSPFFLESASHNLKKTNVIRSSGLLPVDARRIADSIIQRSAI